MNQKKNSDLEKIGLEKIDVVVLCSGLGKIDVVILCGGLGKRLRPIIPNRQKVLAKIGEKSFIDILLGSIFPYGFKNIILCIGHMKEQIKNHFTNLDYRHHNILFSEEKEPLGTGGALKNAESLIMNDSFIVMNGDSMCKVDFKEFHDFHINKDALVSIVLSKSSLDQSNKDYGIVKLDNLQRIISFDEKPSNNNNLLINAGIYLMRKDIFSYMPRQDNFSLEYDLFPKIIKLSSVYGFISDSEVIDIGTPERYEKALRILI